MIMAKVNTELQQLNDNNISISDMLNRFIQFVDVSKASVTAYISGVRAFMRYLHDNGITNPTQDNVLTFKKALTETKSASTVALYLSSLRRFFAWCQSEGLYEDISSGVKAPHVDTGHKKDCFTANQLKAIIGGIERNGLKGKRDYALFALVAATGLRCVEVMRADICDIRNVSGENVLYIQGKGKTSKADFVKLSAPIMNAINDYLSARGNVSDDSPLFASCSRRNFGGRMTTRSISRVCKSAMREAGFDSRRLTAHSLRHSAITIALLAGMSIQEVSQFARHSNISITMIYSHDIERLKSQCENTISNAIFG